MNAKNSTNNIGREEKLKNQLNVFFRKFEINDIYSKMTSNDLIRLKNIVSCVNNIVTLKATESFVKKLEEDEVITNDIANQMRQKISEQSANANGYDVQYDGNLGEGKIIAEVKCNIPPVNKNTFNKQQKDSIEKDITDLSNGKNKGGISKEDLKSYYKFLVILDYEENDGTRNTRKCMKDMREKHGELKCYDDADKNNLDKSYIYVVYVKIWL